MYDSPRDDIRNLKLIDQEYQTCQVLDDKFMINHNQINSNHQVLELLDHCVFPFFGIENGVVQVLGNLDGLFDGELVSSLGNVIASHLGESDGLGGKALKVQILMALKAVEWTESPEKIINEFYARI